MQIFRRNGFKCNCYSYYFQKRSLSERTFLDALALADEAVTDGEQLIAVSNATPTLEAMDKLSLYLN